MIKIFHAVTIVFFMFLFGCSSTPTPTPQQQTDRPDRPEWVRTVPDPDEKYIYFTGKSGINVDESDADTEAMKLLRFEVQRSLEITIAEKQKLAKLRNGLSGSAKEFVELERVFQKAIMIGALRGIKPKSWYHENVKDSKGNPGIRAFVLGRQSLEKLNKLANENAERNAEISKKKIEEEQDEKMKKDWNKNLKMWDGISKENFFQ